MNNRTTPLDNDLNNKVNDCIKNSKNRLSELSDKITNYAKLEYELAKEEYELSEINKNIKLETEISNILMKASEVMRNKAKVHFEKIITDALQFVTQDINTKFIIEESVIRSKPAYEFYVETMINGEICKQKPEEACGGGFIDIISVTAKYAYLQIFSNPEIKSATVILDEPAKMVSEQMSIKFAEYIKFLNKYFNKQTIMITHNENLTNIASKTFYVIKNSSGVSNVKELSTVNTEYLNLLMEEYKKEHQDETINN